MRSVTKAFGFLALALAVVGIAAGAGIAYENVDLPVTETLNVSDGDDVEVAAENVTNSTGENVDVHVTVNASNATVANQTLYDTTFTTGTNTTVSETFEVNETMWDNVTVAVGDEYDTANDTYTAGNLTIQTVSEGGMIGGETGDTMIVVAFVAIMIALGYAASKRD